jgi:hypothetical protein
MSDINLDNALETYRRDGIVVLHDLLGREDVDAIRQGGEQIKARFHDIYGATSPVKTRGGWRLDIPPVNLVRQGGAHYADAVGRMMSHPIIQAAGNAILGPDWNVTALVYDYREPCDDPLPPENFEPGYPPAYFWHADHGRPGLANPDIFTLRFQVYLNDTDFERGAMGYAAGSQRLIKHLRRQLAATAPAGTPVPIIDTHQSVAAAKATLEERSHPLNDEFRDLYDAYMATVPQYDFASDGTAYSASAGSVLMFDDTGMHRGNFVNTDHRYVYRCLCMPVAGRFKDWTSAKNSLARSYYKMTLKQPFRALM